MKIFDVFQLAFNELFTNVLRSVLSILGIAIGIAALISMTALNEGMKHQMLNDINKRGGADIISVSPSHHNRYDIDFETGRSKYKYPINSALYHKFETTFFDLPIIPVSPGPKNLSFPIKDYYSPRVLATSPGYCQVFNLDIIEGRFLSDLDLALHKQVIVISAKIKNDVFKGKPVIGKHLKLSGYKFEIIGVQQSDSDVFIPLTTAINKTLPLPIIDKILIKTGDFEKVEKFVPEIKTFLSRITRDAKLFKIDLPKDKVKFLYRTKDSFSRLLFSITMIGLLVGGVGIMNIMLSSLKDRIREIGVKKSIGAKNRQIFIQFLIESISICIIGGIVGIGIGIWGGDVFTKYLVQDPSLRKIQAVVSYNSILLAFLFSAFVGIIFGIYPAIKAAKINPINALRYE